MKSSPVLLPFLLVSVCLFAAIQCKEAVQPLSATKNATKPLSFNCIVCDDLKDQYCEPWDHFSHSTDCYKQPRIDKSLPVGCRKMIQTIEGKTYVSRHCTNLVDDSVQGCIDRVGTKKIKVMYCHCRQPDCNSGRQAATSSWALHLLSPMGLLLVALGSR